MTERTVEVAILGAGTAGLNALGQVRKHTDNFVLINGGELGTTCARVGCMPSKVAIQMAEDFHRRHAYPRYGVTGQAEWRIDLSAGMQHVRTLRDLFVDRVLSNSTDNLPPKYLIEGYAQFLEPDLLEVNGERIRARKIIIATGSRPFVPPAWQMFGDKVLTTDQFFELESLPARVAVIGLGVIGLEIGQTLQRLGVNVTGFDRLNHIAGLQDPVVNQCAIEVFSQEFPLWLGQAAELSTHGEYLQVNSGEQQVIVDCVLASMGRVPNLDGLGLERLAIPRDPRGVPLHNPHTMQLGDLPIFIAGDVTGERAVLHEAGHEGRIAGYNAVHPVTAFKRKTPLGITFCDPNIASVGAPLASLASDQIHIGEVRMAGVGRAIIMGSNQGMIRVYAARDTGRILGAALLTPKGENLAHLLAWAIEQNLTVYDLLAMPFYHPVLEEALQAALYNLLSQFTQPLAYPVELTPL